MFWNLRYTLTYVLLLFLSGCGTTELAEFLPQDNQESIVRDGIPALISEKPKSIILMRPAKREHMTGQRPVYVVAITNLDSAPVTFKFADIEVAEMRGAIVAKQLKTYSYEELVAEERRRQIWMALATGLSAAGNSMAAANSGYYSGSGTVTGPYGTSHVTVTGYDPTAAAIAQANASARNQAMIANVIETGRQNLDRLESTVLKDNTILFGEWYGGQLQFEPAEGDPPKTYRIAIKIGDELHEITVTYTPQK